MRLELPGRRASNGRPTDMHLRAHARDGRRTTKKQHNRRMPVGQAESQGRAIRPWHQKPFRLNSLYMLLGKEISFFAASC